MVPGSGLFGGHQEVFGLVIDGAGIFLAADGLAVAKLEERSVEAVLDSAFVHNKAFEDI